MKFKTGVFVSIVAVAATLLAGAAELRQGTGKAAGATVRDLARSLVMAAEKYGPETARRVTADLGQALAPEGGLVALTEERAVSMMKDLGVELTTSNPDRLVSQEKITALVRNVESGLVARPGSPAEGGFTSATSPADMEECLTLGTHGACVVCCRSMGVRANACAKTCFAINKPSPSEPLP
ncbi:MAG: hypothetical protein ACRD6R_14345 [Candidatus Polarisedimenticolia bacterium]